MYFIALASHLHYVRPFWKLYPHNGGDLSGLGLIFNPRWLKHPSAWLNVDRAIQLVGEEVEEWGPHPARSDGSKAAGISSRSDEYLNGGLMCATHSGRTATSRTTQIYVCLSKWWMFGPATVHQGGTRQPRRRCAALCPQTMGDGTDRW